jgi:hypothetical protein
MTLYDGSVLSFVIRLERIEIDDEAARWRGHITHIPSGRRRYFQELSIITSFILPYLDEMGVSARDVDELLGEAQMAVDAHLALASARTRGWDQGDTDQKGTSMNEFTWNLNLQVTGGPRMTLGDKPKLDAYDRIDVRLETQEMKKRIDIQPSDDIHLLIIQRNPSVIAPDAPEADPDAVTYKINGKDPAISLKDQHVMLGHGAWKLLHEVPKWLEFDNKQHEAVLITILVGRDARRHGDEEPKKENTSHTNNDEASAQTAG